ncbi:MAG: hypothetical protein BGN88_08620 [Clostridiales bacterium 43-6]|nr:MAG: hypothetical protein BGN88_08620 [Clostridiales bacterium 43-6]
MSKLTITKKNITRLLLFIFIPIAFSILGAFLIFFTFNSVIKDNKLYQDVMVYNKTPNFGTNLNLDFTPSNDTSPTKNLTDIVFPAYGQAYGVVDIPSVGVKTPLIYGDGAKQLENGACQYIGSKIPGYGGTSLISGHNFGAFKGLENVKTGSSIRITTTYGKYEYRITAASAQSAADSKLLNLADQKDNLVLYTCYIGDKFIGDIDKRFYVYGEYVSGPKLQQ